MLDLMLGWLSPEGKLIECGSYEHISVAHDLVNKLCYPKNLSKNKPDDDILIDNGWVHIGISEMEHKYVVWWNYRIGLTSEQKEFLKPYFQKEEFVVLSSLMRWKDEILK